MRTTDKKPPQGAAEKIKRKNDVHLRQLAKKSTYVPSFFFSFFFLVRFWAFLGKGTSKTREKKLSTFQKKTPGKYFSGGGTFFWMIFYGVVRLNFFPPYRFFFSAFLGVSR
jgi:hypothetical protein